MEPDGFKSEKLDKLRGSEEYVIGWTYDDGELQINLQTFGEDEPAIIMDWNHEGKNMH